MFARTHAAFRSNLPSALAATPWPIVLGAALLMLVAIFFELQARPALSPLSLTGTRISPQSLAFPHMAEDALHMAMERLERFNRETRLYRDPDAEVVIPGFGFGSPNAMRLRLEGQVQAQQADHERLRQSVQMARIAAP